MTDATASCPYRFVSMVGSIVAGSITNYWYYSLLYPGRYCYFSNDTCYRNARRIYGSPPSSGET